MTKQEIFDKVWDHFITKKVPRSVEARGACAYRHSSGDGRCCAIGLLIDDVHYKRNLEGLPVGTHVVLNALRASGTFPTDLQRGDAALFLANLQHAHDACVDSDYVFPATLERFARDYGLTVPSEITE